jgi:ribosomal protein L27
VAVNFLTGIGRTLGSYNIGTVSQKPHKRIGTKQFDFQAATLDLVVRLRGGGSTAVVCKGNDFQFYGRTIGDVKLEILERIGVPVRNQTLTYKGKTLLDGKIPSG